MNTKSKRYVRLVAVLLAAATAVMGWMMVRFDAAAAEVRNEGETYYYEELKNSDLAQRLYGAFDKMRDDATFKSGKLEYDLLTSGTLTEAEVADYVENASPKIPVALGAARDAYFMDHPDLFYIDVYKFYLSAGTQNGKYVAFIGTGTAENYYTTHTVSSAAEVDTAIAAYEKAVTELAQNARAVGADAIKQIEYVNNYLAENVAYDYGARKAADSDDVIYDGYVNTAYGALVEKKALCGGYSRAFKAVMDRLQIACVLIQGTVATGRTLTDTDTGEELQPGYEAHMWNAVKINDMWYGVDTTFNSGCGNFKKYLLVGDDFLSRDHFPDGVISSSGFELSYPALRPLNYGVNEDASGFVFKDEGTLWNSEKNQETTFGYKGTQGDEEDRAELILGVSFEGKDALRLQEEGKYLVCRFKDKDSDWYGWYGIAAQKDYGGFEFFGGYSVTSYYDNIYQMQYAVFDHAPDGSTLFGYDASNLHPSSVMATSVIYTNKVYSGYQPAPYVRKKTPDERGTMKSLDTLHITFAYSDKLVYTEEGLTAADVGVTVTGTHKDIEKYCKIENIVWDAENSTLSFDFTPSKQYAHNAETYHFVPTNLVGEKSGKVPDSECYSFQRKQVVCPKVFNDGRLYMQVYGQPKFVGAEDMSLDGFKDKNGQPIVGDQRSQMMLVVNDTSERDAAAMLDALDKNGDISVGKADISRSSTYEIDLQLCGFLRKVPPKSYMQVGFGFPEGYDSQNKNVTYTVYHYKRNDKGEITEVEEVPCVITEYGIIATVDSFSPFMICEVPKAKVSKKNIYAFAEGEGGKIDTTAVQAVTPSGVSYTLVPKNGYKVDKILLNGIDVYADASVCTVQTNGTVLVSIGADDARLTENNTLEASFVATRVAEYNAANGLNIVRHKLVVEKKDMIVAFPHEISKTLPAEKDHTVAIVVTVIVVIVVAAGAAVGIWLYFRHKKNGGTGNKTPTPKAKNGKTRSAQTKPQPSKANPMQTATAAAGVTSARVATQRTTATAQRPATTQQRATAAQPRQTTAQRPAAAQQRPTGTQRPATAQPRQTTAQRPTAAQQRPVAQPRPAASKSAAKRPESK